MDMDILRIMGISSRDIWHALGISGLLVALILFLLAINSFLDRTLEKAPQSLPTPGRCEPSTFGTGQAPEGKT